MFKYVLSLLALSASFYGISQETLDLSHYTAPELVGEYCLMSDGTLSDSNQILFATSSWNPVNQEIISLGVPEKGKWIKIGIEGIPEYTPYILEVNLPTLDTLIAFIQSKGRVHSRQAFYEAQPFAKREFDHQSYHIVLPQNLQEAEVFIYVSSIEQVNLPLTIASYEDQYNTVADRDITFGIYMGIILSMLFYNLFILYSTKEVSYLYYVLYILFVGMVQVSLQGYGYKYLWPNSPLWQEISLNVLNLGTALFAFKFFETFIRLKRILPKWNWAFYGLIALYVLQLIFALLDQKALAYSMMNGIALLLSFAFLLVSALAIYKGSRQAVFFMIAWFAFLSSVIIFVLKDVGVLPYNFFTANILQFGSGLEVILLSFGLADRINILRRDKNKSQQEALDALKENERIIKEQNKFLEDKVKERTSELNNALDDVKNTQSQLVEQEKLASIGQLTAGIAHEINNPINFVYANTKPLKRDIDDLIKLIDQYDSIEDKEQFERIKAEIEDFKEDIEIDYVKTEIEQLLKGIRDGASRTAEIVRGLKIFSRVDEQDIKLFDLTEGIDSTLTLLKSSMNGLIEVHKNYGSHARIECYGGKMNQVFMNILSNAIHALLDKTPKGGEIFINTKDLDVEIEITIRDTAGGIPEEYLSQIFDPFFTTKPVGTGTGLGLAIVKGIIDSHNGYIRVESIKEQGTTFTMVLPKSQPS